MTTFGKAVVTPKGDDADNARSRVHAYLLAATDAGATDIGCTGISFVMIGLGCWASELVELDARAAAELFAALSVICDPHAKPQQKIRAERKRATAVRRLYLAVDLAMTPPEGSA